MDQNKNHTERFVAGSDWACNDELEAAAEADLLHRYDIMQYRVNWRVSWAAVPF